MDLREIAGTDGRYFASSDGNIVSLVGGQPRILRAGRSGQYGHRSVVLYVGGEKRTHSVHVLVLEAWRGHRPVGMVAAHFDGDPANNHPENLSWVTQKENLGHAAVHGTRPKGSKIGTSKLQERDVIEIRRELEQGTSSLCAIARKYGVVHENIRAIRDRRTWNHL